MGFTLQLILGFLLIVHLSCGGHNAYARSVRDVQSQEQTTIKDVGITEKAVLDLEFGKKVTNDVNKEIKPKTDVNLTNLNVTASEKTLIKPQNLTFVKLEKSESYKKIEPLSIATTPKIAVKNVIQKQVLVDRIDDDEDRKEVSPEDKARSIDVDINKYVSPEFHNINNVYTVPISPDTEKYIDQEPAAHKQKSSVQKNHLTDDSFDHTTSISELFDKKYREAVDSVEQQWDHLDSSVNVPETKEEVNLDSLIHQSDKENTTTNLDYLKVKNIVSNNNRNETGKHSDLSLEEATKINFESSYNDTVVIPDHDEKQNKIAKDYSDTAESSISNSETTVKTVAVTTKKTPVTLTKPPNNHNISHILNNKIEVDLQKKANLLPNLITSTTETVRRPSTTTSRMVSSTQPSIDITKRGTVKYADYMTTTVPTTTTTKTTITTKSARNKNKFNKTLEQVVQENQVIPIHVTGPVEDQTVTDSTTVEVRVRSQENDKTTTYPSTTTDIIDTTDSTTLKMDYEDDSTTTMESQTDVPTTTDSSTMATVKIVGKLQFNEETTPQNYNNPEEDSTTLSSTTTDSIPETTTDNVPMLMDLSDKTTTEVPQEITTLETTTEFTTILPTRANRIQKQTTDKPSEIIETTTVQVPEATTFIVNEINKNGATTSKVVIYHIQNIDNHTTLLPEVINPEYNYPTPDIIENDDKNEDLNSTTTVTTTSTGSTTTDDDASTEAAVEEPDDDDNKGTIAAIVISSVGAVCLILLAGLLFIMRKRQKRFNYGERCTPVSLDDYSMDNVSVYNSVRRKGQARASKRSYGNPAFDDPVAVTHPLNFPALAKFSSNFDDIRDEFEEIPQISARISELPEGCETKNRYANVIPLPETRVFLNTIDGYPNSDYINANYVTGPKNVKGYYIACQGPMQNTVDDFWRMIWEQQSKVILMLTQLFENGIEKCVDYLPPSEVLDCHRLFGDFQVTLKKREVKDKYIISSLQLKNMVSNSWREVTHFWYLGWPDKGVPKEPNSIIAFLIEARSHMKSTTMDKKNGINGVSNGSSDVNPVVVHCSPGTGRTGVVIACDIAIREFEKTRLVDIPRIVYKIRRDRASSVQTKEQYQFIYKVVSLYAAKLTGGALDSI